MKDTLTDFFFYFYFFQRKTARKLHPVIKS